MSSGRTVSQDVTEQYLIVIVHKVHRQFLFDSDVQHCHSFAITDSSLDEFTENPEEGQKPIDRGWIPQRASTLLCRTKQASDTGGEMEEGRRSFRGRATEYKSS